MLGLIRELGWQDKVLFPRPYTVLLHNGKWYPFDSIPRAILFPGLGFGLDKVRFGFVGLYPAPNQQLEAARAIHGRRVDDPLGRPPRV